jgi:hypothetical protein
MNLKSKLEEFKLSNECSLNIYITGDEKYYVLEINYQRSRFIAEKQYPNNYYGVGDMEEEKSKYRSENDVKEYFGII